MAHISGSRQGNEKGSRTPLRILILEDSPRDAELEVALLEQAGYACDWTRIETRKCFTEHMAEPWDVIVADYSLPAFDGVSALALVREHGLNVPFVLVSGALGEERGIDALKAGATDYVLKARMGRFVPAIRRALAEAEELRRHAAAEAERETEAAVNTALARVGRELISSLDRHAILERMCRVTTEALDCEAALCIVAQGEVLRAVAAYGVEPGLWEVVRALRVPRERLPETAALAGDEPVEFVRSELSNPVLADLHRMVAAAATLVTPLRMAGEDLGYLVACLRGRNRFCVRQRRIAAGVAELVSLALANSRLLADLEQASRLKSEFIGTISHELRSPLNTIMGYTDLLLDETFGPLTGEAADALRRVRQSSADLLHLVETTLDLSRLQKGELPVDETEVALGEMLAQLEAETRSAWDKPEVELVWNLAPQLPVLRTDRGKLLAVVKNLVENAVKFTDRGSVTLIAEPTDGGVEIEVRDTGVGIAEGQEKFVFEPFLQLEPHMTRTHAGSGLGLYVVQQMLGLLGGTITVESEVGRGSTFRVRLPGGGSAAG